MSSTVSLGLEAVRKDCSSEVVRERRSLGVGRVESGSARGKRCWKSSRTGRRVTRGSCRATSRRSARGESRIKAGMVSWAAARWVARDAPVPVP